MSGPGGDGSAEALVAKAARGIASWGVCLGHKCEDGQSTLRFAAVCTPPCPHALSFALKTALSGRVFAALRAIKGVVKKIKTCGECVTHEDISAAAPTAPAPWRYWPAMRRATAPSRSGTSVAAQRRLPDARAPLRFISDRTRFTPRAAAIGVRLLRGTPSGCQKSLSEGLSPGRLSQSHGQGCYSQRLPLPTSYTGKNVLADAGRFTNSSLAILAAMRRASSLASCLKAVRPVFSSAK